MDILSRQSELITQKIAAMPKGVEHGLAPILGEDWTSIGAIAVRREFGRKFKAAVKARALTEVEWVRMENSAAAADLRA